MSSLKNMAGIAIGASGHLCHVTRRLRRTKTQIIAVALRNGVDVCLRSRRPWMCNVVVDGPLRMECMTRVHISFTLFARALRYAYFSTAVTTCVICDSRVSAKKADAPQRRPRCLLSSAMMRLLRVVTDQL